MDSDKLRLTPAVTRHRPRRVPHNDERVCAVRSSAPDVPSAYRSAIDRRWCAQGQCWTGLRMAGRYDEEEEGVCDGRVSERSRRRVAVPAMPGMQREQADELGEWT